MSKITKCTQVFCPNADKCRRTLAPDSGWQSWATFEFKINRHREVECEYFIPVKHEGKTD